MIWRLAKDHNFTQILTLSKYGHLKGPKLKTNNLKRPKYRDILSKLTKTIGREQEVFKPYFKLLCFIFDCSSLIEIERYVIHKKVSLTYFHFQGVLGQLLLSIIAKHYDLWILSGYNHKINEICRQKKVKGSFLTRFASRTICFVYICQGKFRVGKFANCTEPPPPWMMASV